MRILSFGAVALGFITALVPTAVMVGPATGGATVSVQAAVLDKDHASYAIQKVVDVDAYKIWLANAQYLENEPDESKSPAETSLSLDGVWLQEPGDTTTPHLEIEISDVTSIYQVDGEVRELAWQGTFDAPSVAASTYTWTAKRIAQPDEIDDPEAPRKTASYVFNFENGVVSYTETNAETGETTLLRFQKVDDNSADEVEEPPVNEIPPVTMTWDELCEHFQDAIKEFDPTIAGVTPSVECDKKANEFVVTSIYDVTFDSVGVTHVGSVEVTPEDRRQLPFQFYRDIQYGDVSFTTDVIGLDEGMFPNVLVWMDSIKDYEVRLSYPDGISGYSNVDDGATDDGYTITWNYDTIKNSITAGNFTLKAAGQALSVIDPVPYIITLVGAAFLLTLLLFFSRKIAPRKVAIISWFLIIVSPFGLGMAILARKRARNDSDGMKLAGRSIIANGSVFVFELFFVILTIVLAPQVVKDFLALFGL